jgi:hypothetical protein
MFHRVPHHLRAGILNGSMILLASTSGDVGACTITIDSDEDWEQVLATVETLWSGGVAERSALADGTLYSFRALCWPTPSDRSKEVERTVSLLVHALRTETEDWTAHRLLERLRWIQCPALAPIFLDAMTHTSPNIRWPAALWLREHAGTEALPRLKDAWEREDRPWIRAPLLDALGQLEAVGPVDEIEPLIESDDFDLALAAIRALGAAREPRSVPRLVRAANADSRIRRLEALRALGRFENSPEALETLKRVSRSGDAVERRLAADGLAGFTDPSAAERLIEIARSPDAPCIRGTAVEGLAKVAWHPERVPSLLDLLHEGEGEPPGGLFEEALRALKNIDDPTALAGLADLDPGLGPEEFLTVGKLTAYLSRDREREVREILTWPSRVCSDGFVDPDEPDSRRVRPLDGQASIRCWAAPGVVGDPEDFRRLPAGREAWARDVYELAGVLWEKIVDSEFAECWVRRPELDVASFDGGREAEDGPGFLGEFDLPMDRLRHAAIAVALEAGVLRVFDAADDVVGVRLAPEAGTGREEEIKRLRTLDGRSLFDDGTLRAFVGLIERYLGRERGAVEPR